MSFSSGNENFSLKFDSGTKSSWPLPPSSVFKCRSAQPWIDPELFHIKNSEYFGYLAATSNDYINYIQKKEKWNSQEIIFYRDTEDAEGTPYSQSVEVYGLPLPNTKIKSIEYSDNPEQGIDVEENKSDIVTTNAGNSKNSESNSDYLNLELLELERSFGYRKENQKIEWDNQCAHPRNNEGSKHKKRKRALFGKDDGQSWRLFY